MKIKGHIVLGTTALTSSLTLPLALLTIITIILSFAFSFSTLYPSIPSNATSSSTPSSSTKGAEVGVNVKEFIKLAVDKSALALADGSGHTTISPSPEGTTISGEVNVAVTTNTEKGYDLSVYTQDSSNGMIHENVNVDTEIEAVNNITGYDDTTGISTLGNDTWGFQKSEKGGSASGNWFAVGESSSSPTTIDSTSEDDPSFCSNLSYPLNNTGCSVDTYSTYNINFGAKLTSALPAGTYRNNVVFSAVAKSEGVRYTLSFAANGGQNTMGPRTVLAGSTVTLPTKGFVKEGQGILGWALVDNATPSTTPLYGAGETVQVDTLRTAATNAGQNPESNRNITLYAVWDTNYTVRYNPGNQDATGTTSSSEALLHKNVSLRANGFSREGYNFIGWALADNSQTKDYDAGQSILISTLLSAAESANQTITNNIIDLYAVWEINGPVFLGNCSQDANGAHPTADASCRMADGRDWVLGNNGNQITWNNMFTGATNVNGHNATVNANICPAGYSAPTIVDYDNLILAYGGTSNSGSRSGYQETTGALYSVLGLSEGRYFLSSTEIDRNTIYALLVGRYDSSSSWGTNKSATVYALCYKNQTMQDFSSSSMATGISTTLTDARDNQDYTVYRFPTSGSYPTGMAGYTIMTQDLSLGYGTSSALSLSTDKSAGSGTVNYVNSANNGNGWSTNNSDSNLQYTNGPKSGSETYSSHSYYSYGAAQIVCPKGWAPPTKAQYDNIASFMGGDNATGSSTIRNSTYHFVYGGLFYSSGWGDVGSYGYYWSSTQYNSSSGYDLYFSSSGLLTDNVNKYSGLSVRCVAQ